MIEIQQNSDITYRLYDYGRPRELHLEQAVAVAQARPHDAGHRRHLPDSGSVTLVEGSYFRLHRIDGQPDAEISAQYDGALLVIPLEGEARLAGEPVAPGGCALATSIDQIEFAQTGSCLITQPIAGARCD